MEAEILARLNRINQEFYQTFSVSFSQTRQRIQPGVSRILDLLPKDCSFLDVGCGNGNLACHWVQHGFRGTYHGVDFSPGLIEAAEKQNIYAPEGQEISFFVADLNDVSWQKKLPLESYDSVFCFAVLHHIPEIEARIRLCQQFAALSGSVWLSVWQPLNSPKLSKRIYPWETVGINSQSVDPGDVLMDWRAHVGKDATPAYRYVHIFSESELTELAGSAGYHVDQSFLSDGKGGNLGLYQHWSKNH